MPFSTAAGKQRQGSHSGLGFKGPFSNPEPAILTSRLFPIVQRTQNAQLHTKYAKADIELEKTFSSRILQSHSELPVKSVKFRTNPKLRKVFEALQILYKAPC